ncbi:hypothetical protein SK128_006441 [Halocaridina rubra]|uniref:Uncharacterized protein n=1 Tax=Halocaridina rubra TaxID=373956 RepID=A0AAN8ZXH5_HALRR
MGHSNPGTDERFLFSACSTGTMCCWALCSGEKYEVKMSFAAFRMLRLSMKTSIFLNRWSNIEAIMHIGLNYVLALQQALDFRYAKEMWMILTSMQALDYTEALGLVSTKQEVASAMEDVVDKIVNAATHTAPLPPSPSPVKIAGARMQIRTPTLPGVLPSINAKRLGTSGNAAITERLHLLQKYLVPR